MSETNAKKLVGELAATYVEDGMVVGLGTGSTAYFTIRALGEALRSGLRITAIPTSEQSRELAEEESIPLTDFSVVQQIDLTIDGADEVDPAFNLTKGGGGALLREKIVAAASKQEIIVVDESKLKDRLGAFPLPVEIVPFGWQTTMRAMENLDCKAELRTTNEGSFTTDNGNYILDCAFGRIDDPRSLEDAICRHPGVVECGLFTGLTHRVIVGRMDGTIDEMTEPGSLKNRGRAAQGR